MKILRILIFTTLLDVCGAVAQAQEQETQVIELPAVVQMPQIPDNITDINERYKYFTTHFWDNFDFKQKAVGQYQLDDAFGQYSVGLRLMPADDALKCVDDLIKKVSKNPTLLYQFCVAAENNLYDPNRAEVLIDEVYVKFLDAVIKNKKIKPERKTRFMAQYTPLQGSLSGMTAPQFDYEDRNGAQTRFSPENRQTIIIFGHPDCADCMMTKIKLDLDADLEAKCKEGELRIYFIIPDKDSESWKEMVADYPHFWTVGASDNVDSVYDLRFNPTIYLIGPDRKIKLKSTRIETVIEEAKR